MTDQAISPLRRRMIEDMAIRKLAPKTQHDYVQRVKDFATFLGRSPDTAKSDEVRGFRLHLALRFLFNVTLDRPDLRQAPVVHAQAAQGASRFTTTAEAATKRAAGALTDAMANAIQQGTLDQEAIEMYIGGGQGIYVAGHAI
jgi:hypothetical protein